MASRKAVITEKVQVCIEMSDWKAAIKEMEKLFAIDKDPLVKVRIGDARLKLNRKCEAIRDYVRAGDLFAEKGFVVKALAQYNMVLRLDSSNNDARSKIKKMQMLRTYHSVTKLQRGPMEYHAPQSFEDVVPQYV